MSAHFLMSSMTDCVLATMPAPVVSFPLPDPDTPMSEMCRLRLREMVISSELRPSASTCSYR